MMQEHIIVVEYPKSGGSWFVSLLGDSLDMPKRDIYIADGYKFFNVSLHPWYINSPTWNITEPSIIKSHELPNSSLHDIENKTIHLVRDGRDVIVSKYFYERDFCVRNGIYQSFDTPWEEYVRATAAEWSHFISEWLDTGAYIIYYEELVTDTLKAINSVCDYLKIQVDDQEKEMAIQNNSKEKFRKALDITFAHNSFVRKGIIGDWKNYFSNDDYDVFCRIAGDAMKAVGYSWEE